MKNIFNISMVALLVLVSACDDFDKYELPEANSIPDATTPQAVFTAIKSEELDNDGWNNYLEQFAQCLESPLQVSIIRQNKQL